MQIENKNDISEEEIDEDEDFHNKMLEDAAENKMEEILLKKEILYKEK